LEKKEMGSEPVNLVMTSPPYYGLWDYGSDSETVWGGDKVASTNELKIAWNDKLRFRPGQNSQVGNNRNHEIFTNSKVDERWCIKCGAKKVQLGLESSHEEYIQHMIEVSRLIWRVLAKDGSFYLKLGDTYGGSCSGNGDKGLFQNYRRREVAECLER